MIVASGNLSKNFSQSEYYKGVSTAYMYDVTYTFVKCIQKFRSWLKQPMYVISWWRSKAQNAKIHGHYNSNHLRGAAMDWNLGNGKGFTKAQFISYAKKWAEICKLFGCVGEAGLYDNGWIHLGIQNPTQADSTGRKFVHWHTDKNGRQTNNPYAELRGL